LSVHAAAATDSFYFVSAAASSDLLSQFSSYQVSFLCCNKLHVYTFSEKQCRARGDIKQEPLNPFDLGVLA
jgi:hypothetical protein